MDGRGGYHVELCRRRSCQQHRRERRRHIGLDRDEELHEDFTRFRSGEGSLSEDGTKEVLYGTEGTAPWGTAEYGDGTEMTLRYVTATLGGPDVELILRYRDTALAEIILHTVEEE